MTWELLFLGCFVFGFALSLIAFVAGSAHLHLHVHHGTGAVHGHAGGNISRFNFGTVAAFLTWFGGAGYLLSSWGRIGLALILTIAIGIGFIGAALIFLFAARVLARGDKPLDPADYEVVGALGRVSCPVLQNGTGEMIFVQQGRRAGIPIRSENGNPIPAGREVVVTRYENGIAYVRDWEELTA